MNKELWDEWRALPVTQEVFRALQKYCAEQVASALEDSLIIDSTEQTAMQLARKVGYLEGLKALIDGDFRDDE